MIEWLRKRRDRRAVLGSGLLAALGTGVVLRGGLAGGQAPAPAHLGSADGHGAASVQHNTASHGAMSTVGEVDHARNGFDPHDILTDWEVGEVSTLPDGRRLREFAVTAVENQIEIAPGVMFPAWSYNGRVPGPTLRATEGDLVRIHFANGGSHRHSMHCHGIHSARMDGGRAPATSPQARPSSMSSKLVRSAATFIIATLCR